MKTIPNYTSGILILILIVFVNGCSKSSVTPTSNPISSGCHLASLTFGVANVYSGNLGFGYGQSNLLHLEKGQWGASTKDSISIIYKYSKSNKIVSASRTSGSNTIVYTFQYNTDSSLVTSLTNGSIIWNFTYNSSNQMISYNQTGGSTYSLTYQSNSSNNPMTLSNSTLNYNTNFEYDNNHNPFTAIYVNPTIYFTSYPGGPYPYYPTLPIIFSANNVTSASGNDGANTFTNTITYTYSTTGTATGYPLTAVLSLTNNGSPNGTFNYTFTYSNCN